jgi:hypothetical protein
MSLSDDFVKRVWILSHSDYQTSLCILLAAYAVPLMPNAIYYTFILWLVQVSICEGKIKKKTSFTSLAL